MKNNTPSCHFYIVCCNFLLSRILTLCNVIPNHVTIPYSPQFYNGKIEIAITNLNYNNGTTEIDRYTNINSGVQCIADESNTKYGFKISIKL